SALDGADFDSNTASGSGGALWTSAALNMHRVSFTLNKANGNGGALFNSGASTLDRISFIENTSGNNGAALYNSGTSVLVTNSIFSRNRITSSSTYYGAAIYNITGALTLNNNTFSNNSIAYANSGTASVGAALYLKSGTVNAYNSIFWGNTRGNSVPDKLNAGINVVNGLVEQGYPAGVNVLIGNPEFEDAANDNLRLKGGSPAVDAGDNSKNVAVKDLDGNARVVNEIIDLGAYESAGGSSI